MLNEGMAETCCSESMDALDESGMPSPRRNRTFFTGTACGDESWFSVKSLFLELG